MSKYRKVNLSGYTMSNRVWPGLGKVIEECGEVVQVAAKIIVNHGSTEYYDGSDLRSHLEDEIADLEATLEFLKSENGLDRWRIYNRKQSKLLKFHKWKANNE